ncbi:MAG: tRNA uracil 4-sulfurtransferase ThiI [candidate division WOR-3 bacterium]
MRKVWLVRYSSEIFTKGEGLKRQLIFNLQKSIEEALKRNKILGKVWRDRDRIYVESDENISGILSRVFGISSFSPTYHFKFEGLEELKKTIRETFGESVRGKKFAVRVKTRDKGLSIRKLESELGSALYDLSSGVDLENPEIQINLEIRGDDLYAFTETYKGQGGFPSGSQGKAISLISGGFDSAVASWMGLKRGLKITFVLFDLGGKEHVVGAYEIVNKLYNDWIFGYEPEFYVFGFSPVLIALSNVKPKLRLIILKRAMYRLGEILAKNIGADAIITGESLGQVSTQTIHNLRIIEESVNMPVFRPLIFMDKEEIIRLSRVIGTYTISERIPEYCAIAPPPPPKAKLSEVKSEEKKVINALEEVINSAKKIPVSGGYELEEEIFMYHIPEGAVIIGLERVDFFEFMDNIDNLDKSKKYVFVCKEGIKSRQMAKILRNKGFNAYYTLTSILQTDRAKPIS